MTVGGFCQQTVTLEKSSHPRSGMFQSFQVFLQRLMVNYWNRGTGDLPDFSDTQRYVSDSSFFHLHIWKESLPSQYSCRIPASCRLASVISPWEISDLFFLYDLLFLLLFRKHFAVFFKSVFFLYNRQSKIRDCHSAQIAVLSLLYPEVILVDMNLETENCSCTPK